VRYAKPVLLGRGALSAYLVLVLSLVLLFCKGISQSATRAEVQPTIQIPSNVAWTEETIRLASGGDAFRGLLWSRRCSHCHGSEGFSEEGGIPDLAGLDRLSLWKQLQDFRAGKRRSAAMQPIASGLSDQNIADLAAYFSMLPTSPDPQDNRAFPQPILDRLHTSIAVRLVVFGDAARGIPPCQACHGPVGFIKGAPSLMTQNGTYLRNQMQQFSDGSRANDINVVMRSIVNQLTDVEKTSLAEFYGAGPQSAGGLHP